jgi:xanthine/CO dehydrogenase XdhC/CoxF family maturation factor
MREHRQIIQRWRDGAASILVTVVRVQGSSYRQPGAHLIVGNDGTYEGSISAGCLESDLLRKANWLVRDGASVQSYSTLIDEMAEMPFGLGCGGVIDVLLEPVDTPECVALMEAIDSSLDGHELFIVTWLPTIERKMMRAVFGRNGDSIFSSAVIEDELLRRMRAICMSGAQSDDGAVYIERLVPPQRLVILGAGDDARPLASLAHQLGWNTVVMDSRSQLARKERFPEAAVTVGDAESSVVQSINAQDAVVLMTHSYEQDRNYLASVLPLRPKYLGLLGSRKRSALLMSEVASRLDWAVEECCEQISAPVGLDLGGEGPEAIALAIIAEIQATRMGKRVDSRRLSADYVRACLSDADMRRYVESQCSVITA